LERYILCIDMDSVIVDLMSEWYKKYNQDYNDNLTINRITTWRANEYVKEECGSKIYDYLNEEGLFLKLKPLPHSIEVINRLVEIYEVLIVTASPSKIAYQEKEEWILKHLSAIPRENIIFTHRKELIKGDLLFDDAPHNLLSFESKGGIAVAMDYPYNREVNCERVSSWLEFENKVQKLLPNNNLLGKENSN
jgi:5'-nucleotidase